MRHTMAVAIAIPIVFLLTKFVKNEGGVFTIIYAIMGIASSAMAIQIMNQPDCKDGVKKDKRTLPSSHSFSGLSYSLRVGTLP